MRRSPKPGSNLPLVFMVVIVVVMAVVVGFIIGNWMLGYLLGPQEMETVSFEPLTEEVIHLGDLEEEGYLEPEEIEEMIFEGTYLIQLGAFQQLDNAKSLTRELQGKGYSAFMTEDQPYRVQVGMFRTREEAEKLKAELEADGYEVFISR